MKKFSFRLQALLDIRKAKVTEIQNELAKKLSVQNQEREKQNELKRAIEIQKAKFSEKMKSGKYQASEAVMFERFVDISRRAIELAEKKIQAMEPEIRKVRQKLVEASREHKAVERLRERRQSEYNYELNREYAKENDEMNQKIYTKHQHESRGEAL
jgi:flagellar export protein FliJ